MAVLYRPGSRCKKNLASIDRDWTCAGNGPQTDMVQRRGVDQGVAHDLMLVRESRGRLVGGSSNRVPPPLLPSLPSHPHPTDPHPSLHHDASMDHVPARVRVCACVCACVRVRVCACACASVRLCICASVHLCAPARVRARGKEEGGVPSPSGV